MMYIEIKIVFTLFESFYSNKSTNCLYAAKNNDKLVKSLTHKRFYKKEKYDDMSINNSLVSSFCAPTIRAGRSLPRSRVERADSF